MVVSCWLLTRNMDKEDDAEFVREVEAQSKANAAIDLAPRGKLVFATGTSTNKQTQRRSRKTLALKQNVPEPSKVHATALQSGPMLTTGCLYVQALSGS
jgi:hypothetical protein